MQIYVIIVWKYCTENRTEEGEWEKWYAITHYS